MKRPEVYYKYQNEPSSFLKRLTGVLNVEKSTRTGQHNSSFVKSIRLTGGRFAKEDITYSSVKLGYSMLTNRRDSHGSTRLVISWLSVWRVTSTMTGYINCDESFDASWIESIRQYLQPHLIPTCGMFSKCLANRFLVWLVDFHLDESFDSTTFSTTLDNCLRNILYILFSSCTRGIFSKCHVNRLPVWWDDMNCDKSFVSTKSTNSFRGHCRIFS